MSASACGVVSAATKGGMRPILVNGIDSFVAEPDADLGERALAANLKLIEGVAATYPDDGPFLEMAAMARANYAFGFVQDDLEACRLARPDDSVAHQRLLDRVLVSYARGRRYAMQALLLNGAFADALDGADLETASIADVDRALATLTQDDASALFWLAFTWGGALQAGLDPAQATQLPKIERMVNRVLELDDRVFYGVGPHMMAGVLHGFRAPALGGQPDLAARHFDEARQRGGILLPDVLKAQFVYAQTERAEDFKRVLKAVIDAPSRDDRALLETVAKKKACRLLANVDTFFLEDAQPVPAACHRLPHKYPLRSEPLEEADQ